MTPNVSIISRLGLTIACAAVVFQAQASPEQRKAAVVATAAESMLAFATLVKDHSGGRFKFIKWSTTNSTDRTWTIFIEGDADGRPIKATLSGFVWGDDDRDLSLVYQGTGNVGAEPLSIYGKADWIFDPAVKDYLVTDFRHATKFGANSFWGWVVGGEILVGGVVGGGGAVATASLATGGVALGLAPWIAGAGAIAGASALVSVSNTVRVVNESNQPVPPPPLPARPGRPRVDEQIRPEGGRIYIAMTKDGNLLGGGPDASLVLRGGYKEGSSGGEVSAR